MVRLRHIKKCSFTLSELPQIKARTIQSKIYSKICTRTFGKIKKYKKSKPQASGRNAAFSQHIKTMRIRRASHHSHTLYKEQPQNSGTWIIPQLVCPLSFTDSFSLHTPICTLCSCRPPCHSPKQIIKQINHFFPMVCHKVTQPFFGFDWYRDIPCKADTMRQFMAQYTL